METAFSSMALDDSSAALEGLLPSQGRRGHLIFRTTDMPRRPRILLAAQPQHIGQRGINREPCYFADEDYLCYLHWLEEAAPS